MYNDIKIVPKDLEDFLRVLDCYYPTSFKTKVLITEKQSTLLRTIFPALLEKVESRTTRNNYFNLVTVATKTGLLHEYFPNFLQVLHKLPYERIISYKSKNEAFSELVELAKKAGWIEDYILLILETIRKSEEWDMFPPWLFSEFMNTISSQKEILITFQAQIDPLFLECSQKMIDDLNRREINTGIKYDYKNIYYVFFYLIDSIKKTPIFSRYLPKIKDQCLNLLEALLEALDIIDMMRFNYLSAFSNLITKFCEYGFLEESLPKVLDMIKKVPKRHEASLSSWLTKHYDEYFLFSHLIKTVKGTKMFAKFYSRFERYTLILLETKNEGRLKYDGSFFKPILNLIKAIKDTSLLTKLSSSKFLILLDSINLEGYEEDKYRKFSDLIEVVKKTKIFEKCYIPIETQFLKLLEEMDDLCNCDDVYCERYPHKKDVGLLLLDTIRGTSLYELLSAKKKINLMNDEYQKLITSFL